MTGGQVSLSLDAGSASRREGAETSIRRLAADRPALKIIRATAEELAAHEQRLDAIDGSCEGTAVWRRPDA